MSDEATPGGRGERPAPRPARPGGQPGGPRARGSRGGASLGPLRAVDSTSRGGPPAEGKPTGDARPGGSGAPTGKAGGPAGTSARGGETGKRGPGGPAKSGPGTGAPAKGVSGGPGKGGSGKGVPGGKGKGRRRPQLTGRAAILAVVVCAIAMSLAYPVREYISTRRDVARLEAERDRVEAERLKVEEERRRVLDPNWTRRAARERLHLCEPGAKCYMVPKPHQDKGTATARQNTAAQQPWYETLWESVVDADSGATAGSGGRSGKQ